MKKIFSMMIAIILALALCATAFATEDNNGTITINGASADNVYSIYKLLDLESYDTAAKTYSYTVNDTWKNFFATEDAKKYFSVDAQGYATWIGADTTVDADAAAFAKLALAYAKANSIAAARSTENEAEYETVTNGIKFTNLELGYYLVDSTMGALCGLTTTNPNASINAKNGMPTIDKQVKEDSTSQYDKENTADIGQTVEFRVTIDVHAGAENYVFHDKMDEGLTFIKVTEIEHVVPGTDTHTVPAEKYTVKENVTHDVETEDGETGTTICDFDIEFTQAFCDELKTNDKVIIYYTATLNEKAKIYNGANRNIAQLEFGEDHFTAESVTETKTFAFDLVKTDSQNTLIDGAEFRIYDAATGGNEIKVVLVSEETEDNVRVYRRAMEGETGVATVVADGMVRLIGFDNGTYYLEETVTPAGYNQLAARKEFTISGANLDAIFNGEIFSTGSGVHVVNKSGTMLPETGGIGTTLFYVIGGTLFAAALVLLITKKRMSEK